MIRRFSFETVKYAGQPSVAMPDSPPRCLFIKPKLIGDTLLLTPTLHAVRRRHPGVTIDLLIRSGCESILEGCTAHDRIFTTARPDTDQGRRRWREQWSALRAIRGTHYDWVFECSDSSRGRYGALAARGRRRVFNRQEVEMHGSAFDRFFWPAVFSDGMRFEWRNHHATEGSYLLARKLLDLPERPPELDYRPMSFDPGAARIDVPAGFMLSPSRLIVHGGTRLASKSWPDENWLELIGRLAPRFEQVFLSVGPSGEEMVLARRLVALAPGKIFCPAGPLPWRQLAALLQGARLFVGLDTAAMHLAVACHCPALAIWGPTSPMIFGPLSANAAIVVGNRVVRPPYGPAESHDEARVASRNSPAVVFRAANEVLAGRAS